MAVSGNGHPDARFQPYVPQPEPGAGQPEWAFDPDDQDPRREPQSEPDEWTFDPDIKLPNDAYRGVRRAYATPAYRRVGLVVGVVLVLLAAGAVALSIAMKPGADTTNGMAGGDSPTTLGPSDRAAAQPTSLPPSIATTSGVPVAASPVGLPAFAPLTFEAEAGPPSVKHRGGNVETLAGASGGKVVRFGEDSGALDIRGITLSSAGTYRITIYYASGASGSAVVSVSNGAPLTVHFAAGSGCCAAAAVDVALPSGQHTITISDVTDGVAIDKVVITRSPT
jgi:hypothetical protein